MASKGLMLDAASTLVDTGFKVDLFSVSCEGCITAASKGPMGEGGKRRGGAEYIRDVSTRVIYCQWK